jgi:DNA polymerase elongation subunit (family B)
MDNEQKIKILERQISQLDIQQFTKKIFLNKLYGYFAEHHSPLYDIDLAESITQTGRELIKKASSIAEDYVENKHGIITDCVIANDTDSLIITIQPILDKNKQPFFVENTINPYVTDIATEFNNILNTEIKTWAKDELKSEYCTYNFKRESISSSGIFLEKKRYILNVIEDDGFKTDKFKYTGVEVVTTKTPKKVKPLIKNAIQTIIKKSDKKEVDQIIKDTYKVYQTFSIEDQAVTISLNNYEKYYNRAKEFKAGKGTPNHVKGAIYYNLLLKKYKIDNKYESLKSGDKIKTFYVLPNKYNIESIAFLNKFPEEFKTELSIDIKKMYEKTLLNPIKSVFDVIGWQIKNPSNDEQLDLLEFFGLEN